MDYVANLITIGYILLGYGVCNMWKLLVKDEEGLVWVLLLWPVVLMMFAAKAIKH